MESVKDVRVCVYRSGGEKSYVSFGVSPSPVDWRATLKKRRSAGKKNL